MSNKYTKKRLGERQGFGRAVQAERVIGDIVYRLDLEIEDKRAARQATKQQSLAVRKFSWEK